MFSLTAQIHNIHKDEPTCMRMREKNGHFRNNCDRFIYVACKCCVCFFFHFLKCIFVDWQRFSDKFH